MKPDLPTATQGQLEAGPALTEIEPHFTESFLTPEDSGKPGDGQGAGESLQDNTQERDTRFDGCEPIRDQSGTPKEAPPVPAVNAPQPATINPQPIEGRSVPELTEALRRSQILARIDALVAAGCPIGDARAQAGISAATYSRWRARLAARGSLVPDRHKSGRRRALELSEAEEAALKALYQRSNKDEWSGSMRTAAKWLANHPDTREEVRGKILSALETSSRVPGFVRRALERVTRAHTQQRRQPSKAAIQQFAGTVGAFFGDKNDRRRIIESDDGTLNFVCWIPWPMGGDPCSDKYGVRIGRWQFLPAIEAGWSHFYLGYALVCRARASYREEDIRSLIHLVALAHGLPDGFRFERGSWEANNVVALLRQLGVQLHTVYQPNQKPFVEGGFSKQWDYLSMIDKQVAQVGRYRGEMEEANRLVERCKAGRVDPREQFPSLAQTITAIDGTLAMRNSDTIQSIYGKWVPEIRFKEHAAERPWAALPANTEFLFAPYVRDWTVNKGTVGGKLPLLDDFSVPFYFADENLWRWNGRKVRVYFDPAAEQCTATIVSLSDYHGFRPDEIICRAELVGDLTHFARASLGWSEVEAGRYNQALRLGRAACRREVRALGPDGQLKLSTSEARDGQGNVVRVTTDPAAVVPRATKPGEAGSGTLGQEARATTVTTKFQARPPGANHLAAPTADVWARRQARLAQQAAALNLTPETEALSRDLNGRAIKPTTTNGGE